MLCGEHVYEGLTAYQVIYRSADPTTSQSCRVAGGSASRDASGRRKRVVLSMGRALGSRPEARTDGMTETRHAGGYDEFAWLYDRRWGEISLAFVPVLYSLVLDALPAESHILDLACGTGQLTALLAERGFEMTGLDSSAGMLAIARTRAPDARFVQADARSFELPDRFDAVVSVFDSLNHIMSVDDLRAVFLRVRDALAPGGRFVFDLNTVEAVGSGRTDTMVADDHVAVASTTFDPPTRVLTFEAIIFRPQDGLWERSDVHLLQRCHEEQEVRDALTEAGFLDVDVVSSEEVGHRPGRLFYAARAPR